MNLLKGGGAIRLLLVAASASLGCGLRPDSIKIDGSSTVYPISEAVAEEFHYARPDVRVTVGYSGTGGGMKKFTAGEIDVCCASRGIKPSEVDSLESEGVGYTEFSVAFDGIAIAVNPENDWVQTLTVGQLASIWRPDDPARTWSDVDPSWPDEQIRLYGPGADSGTFDYFTKVIVGEEKACRSDFTQSEDDNVLVTGVSEDKYSLGYFGFAYYVENADRLKVVTVVLEEGADGVAPAVETIRSNAYAPLSRPLFIYVRDSLMATADGREFVRFYLDNTAELSTEVGYVPVSDEVADDSDAKYEEAAARQPSEVGDREAIRR